MDVNKQETLTGCPVVFVISFLKNGVDCHYKK